MKVLSQMYLEAPLASVADLLDEHKQILVKRNTEKALVILSLEEYNELKKIQYEAQKKQV